jgi:hypothetical protein
MTAAFRPALRCPPCRPHRTRIRVRCVSTAIISYADGGRPNGCLSGVASRMWVGVICHVTTMRITTTAGMERLRGEMWGWFGWRRNAPPLLEGCGHGCYSNDNEAGPSLVQRCGDGGDDDAGTPPSFRDLGTATTTTLAPPSFRDVGTATTTMLAPPLLQRPGDGDDNDAGPSPLSETWGR